MLFLILFFFSLPWMICSGSEDLSTCYFRVIYSNGSQSWCLDEECGQHLDPIAIEDLQCRTHFLSLRFSSYFTYELFLRSASSRQPLASFFSTGRPNLERLLQIELLSPLDNDRAFELEQLKLLTNGSSSNIDTYELLFPGRITADNRPIILDEDLFLSERQSSFDTLRLTFNCTLNQAVEWELVQSIASIPDSPCPQQITLERTPAVNNEDQLPIAVLTGCIAFACLMVTAMVGLILFYSAANEIEHEAMCDSRVELISMIERF